MARFIDAGFPAEAIDLPGHGINRVDIASLQTLGLKDYANAIERHVQSYSESPILVGHSMGGYLAQDYVLRGHPARALVLLASVPPRAMRWEMLQFAFRHPMTAVSMDWSKQEAMQDRMDRVRSILMTPKDSPEQVRFVADLLQAESLHALKELGLHELPEAHLPVPVFVGIGAQDILIRPEIQATMARDYGVTPHIYPEMAHMLPVETGFETVVADVQRFLAPLISR